MNWLNWVSIVILAAAFIIMIDTIRIMNNTRKTVKRTNKLIQEREGK